MEQEINDRISNGRKLLFSFSNSFIKIKDQISAKGQICYKIYFGKDVSALQTGCYHVNFLKK